MVEIMADKVPRPAPTNANQPKGPRAAACADACNAYARENGYDVHFNRLSIQQYVGCQTNLSMKRLKILADLLRITNYKELNEVFVAPKVRGAGLWWIGEDGHRVQDLDLTMINLKQYKDKYCHN